MERRQLRFHAVCLTFSDARTLVLGSLTAAVDDCWPAWESLEMDGADWPHWETHLRSVVLLHPLMLESENQVIKRGNKKKVKR